MKKLLLISLLFTSAVLCAGCVTLQEFAETAATVPAEEIATQTEATRSIIDDYLDEPYETGGALAIGYVLALLRQLYKKKKQAQANS